MPAPLSGVQNRFVLFPGLRFAHPGLHARTPFRGAKQVRVVPRVTLRSPWAICPHPFQGCKTGSCCSQGYASLTLGYMPAPLSGVQNRFVLFPGLRFAHPGLHARTPFRGAKQVRVVPRVTLRSPWATCPHPFQGCKTGSCCTQGYAALTLGYMPAPLSGVQSRFVLFPGLRFAHPGLHARTPFRGAKQVRVVPRVTLRSPWATCPHPFQGC